MTSAAQPQVLQASNLRSRYFATLGLSENRAEPASSLKDTLSRAYALRTFEIEHYWKRGTYFWGFQVAIFAAFGLLWKDAPKSGWHSIMVGLAALGVLTALANYFSSQGSQFWQKNWEKHIDMLEDGIEGRLHKTVWLDDGEVAFSVSRINRELCFAFIGFWSLVLTYAVWTALGISSTNQLHWITSAEAYVPIILLSTLCIAFRLGLQRTALKGTFPAEDGSHASEMPQPSFWTGRVLSPPSPAFVRRYAPDEPKL